MEQLYTNKTHPEILCHPHIPKPLHGINPRTIMGQEWWDRERQKVYASTNYHCVACGVHKTKAKKHKWLEAHEFWKIDYLTGVCEISSIEPLCHYCHNFIHSGRLAMIQGKEKSTAEIVEILEHGFSILLANNLRCFPFTKEFAEKLNAKTFGVLSYDLPATGPEWGEWILRWNGQEYRSKFKDYEDWQKQW